MHRELICESPSVAITHVERIEHGVYAQIALAVLPEGHLDAVEHVVSHGIPEHPFHPAATLLVRGHRVGGVLDGLRSQYVVHDFPFLSGKCSRAHAIHKGRIVSVVVTVAMKRIVQAVV